MVVFVAGALGFGAAFGLDVPVLAAALGFAAAALAFGAA